MAPDQIAIVRNYAIIARVAGAKDEYEHAVAAVKVLLNQPEYDKLRGILNVAVQFIQNGDLQVGLDLHLLSVKKYPGEALAWYNFGVTMHRCSQIEQPSIFIAARSRWIAG